MRRTLLAVILMIFTFNGAEAVEEDKFKHGSVSLFFGAAASRAIWAEYPHHSTAGRWVAGTTLALIPGVMKELTDEYFDKSDMAANFIGSLVGVVLGDVTGGRIWVRATDETFIVGLRFASDGLAVRSSPIYQPSAGPDLFSH